MRDNVVRPEFDRGEAYQPGMEDGIPGYLDEAFDALYGESGAAPETAPKSPRGRKPKAVDLPLPNTVGVTFDDLFAYMPMHAYIFAPSRDVWPAASVDARLPRVLARNRDGKPIMDEEGKAVRLKASSWLDRNKPVEQMTWAPGMPMIIPDRLISDGGWIEREGCSCFNRYLPPVVRKGDYTAAGRWIDHVYKVYPDDAAHIIQWLAQRVQQPEVKINHGLVFGGRQGIGKDSILEPVKYAIGPWNFSEVEPKDLLSQFNPFVQSVILRISEARDLGEIDRYGFYDHMKTYMAAPPDMLPVNDKNIRRFMIFNVTGVIITTNHKTDGIFLPADDRRHYVAWSELSKESYGTPEEYDEYFTKLYGWLNNGGNDHVAAYLAKLDLSGFNPKAPPPKTEAFWAIVNSNAPSEDGAFRDVIDALENPEVLTKRCLMEKADSSFANFLSAAANIKKVGLRLEECGYEIVRNKDESKGRWQFRNSREVVYAKASLSVRDRFDAVDRFITRHRVPRR